MIECYHKGQMMIFLHVVIPSGVICHIIQSVCVIHNVIFYSFIFSQVYFHSVWNTCEFIIAAGSVLELILQNSLSNPIVSIILYQHMFKKNIFSE